MSVASLLVAGLASTGLVSALPLNGSNVYAVEEASLVSGLTLRYPEFLLEKRHDEEEQHGYGDSGYDDGGYVEDGEPDNRGARGPEPPPCDRICVQHLLFQTAYSSVSTGMEYAMAVHKAQEFCSGEGKDWCPHAVDSKTTMIASQAAYMNIDADWCDDACLMVAMGEVAKQGALQGMKWVDENFGTGDSGADPVSRIVAFPLPFNSSVGANVEQAEVDKLHWSMWYLTGAGTSVDAAQANRKEPPKPRPSNSWNTTSPAGNATAGGQNRTTTSTNSTALGPNSTASGTNSTSNTTSWTTLSGSYQGKNLLLPYITGGACIDSYLCQDSNKAYISQLLDKSASGNGTTWLGFMLAGAAASNVGGPGKAVPKQTYPAWVKEPHCGGGGYCPTPPDVGPQRPPPDFSPQNIAPPPPNPYAPEQPIEQHQAPPAPEEQPKSETDEDKKAKDEFAKKESERIDTKCGDDKQCRIEESEKSQQKWEEKQQVDKDERVHAAEEEDQKKKQDQEVSDQKKVDEGCKNDPNPPQCKIDAQKKLDELDEQRTKNEAAEEYRANKKAEDKDQALQDKCQNVPNPECVNDGRKKTEETRDKEAKEVDQKHDANVEECKSDPQPGLCVVNKDAEDLKQRQKVDADEKKVENDKVLKEMKEEHGPDSTEVAREKANQEERLKANKNDQEKAVEEAVETERMRKKKGYRINPETGKPGKSSLRNGNVPYNPDHRTNYDRPEEMDPFETYKRRFRSTRYDPETGDMKQRDLIYRPGKVQDIQSMEPQQRKKYKDLIQNNYHIFEEAINGRPTGHFEWQHWGDLIDTTDERWLRLGDFSARLANGGIARNGLGDPVVGGRPGDPPVNARSVANGRRVRWAEQQEVQLFRDDPGEPSRDGRVQIDRMRYNPNQSLRQQANWDEIIELQDSTGEKGLRERLSPNMWEESSKTWKDRRIYADDEHHPYHDLNNNRPNKGMGLDGTDDSPGGPDGRHGSSPDNHHGGKGVKGKHPDFKVPHSMKINGNSFIKQIPRRLINAGTAAIEFNSANKGPEGAALAIATAYGQELFFLADAKGDWDVYWDCLKSRINLFHENTCGAFDADGNPIEVEDKGPWRNFYDNTIAQLKPSDIDGDGHKENIWEKFVASMEDTGHQVKEFFVDGEDGKGFGENFIEGYLNIGMTMTDGLLKGVEHTVEWVSKTGGKIWHTVKKPFKWIGKKLKKLFD